MKCIKGSFTNRSNSNPLYRLKWEVFFRKFSKKIPKIDLVMHRMDGNKFKIILSFDKLTFRICFSRNIDRILFQQWWVFFSFFEKLTSHFFGKLSKNVSGKWLHYNWEKKSNDDRIEWISDFESLIRETLHKAILSWWRHHFSEKILLDFDWSVTVFSLGKPNRWQVYW